MSRRLLIISVIIGCLSVSISPLFDHVTVTENYNLHKHRLGFPLPIIEQNTSLTSVNEPFSLGVVSPQEHPTELLVFNYFLSIVIVTLVVYLLMMMVKLFLPSRLKRNKKSRYQIR